MPLMLHKQHYSNRYYTRWVMIRVSVLPFLISKACIRQLTRKPMSQLLVSLSPYLMMPPTLLITLQCNWLKAPPHNGKTTMASFSHRNRPALMEVYWHLLTEDRWTTARKSLRVAMPIISSLRAATAHCLSPAMVAGAIRLNLTWYTRQTHRCRRLSLLPSPITMVTVPARQSLLTWWTVRH